MNIFRRFFAKKPPEPRASLQIVQTGFEINTTRILTQGEIIHNRLDYGDGVIGWDNPIHFTMRHKYEKEGTYVLSLIVIDKYGRVSEFNKTITVPPR